MKQMHCLLYSVSIGKMSLAKIESMANHTSVLQYDAHVQQVCQHEW